MNDPKIEKLKKTGSPTPVVVKTRDGKSAPGLVYIQSWNEKQRLKRALKTLGLGWGLAVLSVFLPIAHFILVPGFFLGAIAAAIYAHRQQSAVLGGESTCPHCGKLLPLEGGADVWPLEDLCSLCQTHVLIEKAAVT